MDVVAATGPALEGPALEGGGGPVLEAEAVSLGEELLGCKDTESLSWVKSIRILTSPIFPHSFRSDL